MKLSNLFGEVVLKTKEIFSKETLEKTKIIFRNVFWNDPKVGVPAGAGVVFLLLGLFFLFKGYSIDSSIQDPALLVPKKANLLIELYRPEEFIADLEKTSLGKNLSGNGAYQKLFTLPELKKVSSILYLLEAKAGIMTDPSRLASLFDGPIAVALFTQSNWLLVGKASSTSKLGVSLITAFKGEKITAKQEPKQEANPPVETNSEEEGYPTPTGSQKTHSADDFTDQFAAGSEKFGNLEVLKYEFASGKVYAVVLGDFLILANSEDLLDDSLKLASSADNNSLGNQQGFQTIRKEASKSENKLLLYSGPDSLLAPLLRSTFGNSGAAFLLGWESGKNLDGKIYRIGGESPVVVSSEPALAKVLPRESNFVFYSEELKPSELWKSLESLNGDWENFGKGFTNFGASAGIHDQYFGSGKGVALNFHGLDYKGGMIYPRFGISLPAGVPDDKLLKAIFKVGNPTKQQFQNTSLDSYPLKKGGYYTPTSVKIGDWRYFASDKKSAEEIISAGNKNRPSQADIFTGSDHKDLGYYPHHIIVRIPGILEDLRNFYLYGAEGASEYTYKTIDRDVQPFLDILKSFERLVISFGSGKEGEDWGKLKVFSP